MGAMTFWSKTLRRKKAAEAVDILSEGTRLSQDDWAAWMSNTFTFNGNAYPITGYSYAGSDVESPPNDFEAYVHSAYKSNGIVFACAMTRAFVFTEMRFCFQQLRKGRPVNIYTGKNLGVLEYPWPNGSTAELLMRALQDTDIAGNFYVVKEFDRTMPAGYRLRRLRPDWVDILLTNAPEDSVQSDVKAYIYKPGGTTDKSKWVIYPIDGSNGEVAHWSPIPDPEAQYRGMSWMTPIIREIMSDKGALKHKQKFFEQGATPQIAISMGADVENMTKDQIKDLIRNMNQDTSGVDNAYKTMYLAPGSDIHVIGAHLAQLDFTNMQGHGETRIAAAARVHPVLVGLAEAIKGTPLAIGNYQAAKDMFGEATMRPLWRSLCDALDHLVDTAPGSRLWYDDRDVSFLRQDRQAEADLQLSNAQTLNTLIMAGYEPDSCVKALVGSDWTLLSHTGLTSVQMQPPGDGTSGGPGNQPGPGVPPGPVPDPKSQGQKSVTPVPKTPKNPSEPKMQTNPNDFKDT